MDAWHIRAKFDEARQIYVIDAQDCSDPALHVEYRFELIDSEKAGYSFEGGIEKAWLEDGEELEAEFCTFGHYVTQADFEQDVQAILAEARQRSAADNLDAFLAVLDVIKERMVELDLEDEDILDWEGLFEFGPEDGYTLHEMDEEARLHDHVEHGTTPWRLTVNPVVDPSGQPLGWAVFAIGYSTLPDQATIEQLDAAECAEVLDVEHFAGELDAQLAHKGLYHYMATGQRLHDPTFARMSDVDVLELLVYARPSGRDDETVTWLQLCGDDLQAFLNGSKPFVIPREKWEPRQSDLFEDFAQDYGLAPGMADQVRSGLSDLLGVEPEELDDDSPWNDVHLDNDE